MRLWEFVIAATVSEVTPGPNMGYLIALSLAQGRRAGLAAVAGIALGLALLGLAAAFGFGLVAQQFPGVGEALRWLGIAYLFWLAFDAWRGSDIIDREPMELSFRRGLIVNVLNPKAALFYVVVLPLFLDGADQGMSPRLLLTAVFVVIATVVHGGLVVGAASLRDVLASATRERSIRRAASVMLALVALWFAWQTRNSATS